LQINFTLSSIYFIFTLSSSTYFLKELATLTSQTFYFVKWLFADFFWFVNFSWSVYANAMQ